MHELVNLQATFDSIESKGGGTYQNAIAEGLFAALNVCKVFILNNLITLQTL